MSDYKGRCFCGAVEFTVSGQPAAMGYCHCTSCRHWSAGPVNAFSLWPPEALKVTKGAEHIGTYNKTPMSLRKWCKQCGGHLFSDHPPFKLVDIYAALLPELLAASRRVRDRVRSGELTHGYMHRTGREVGFAPHPEPWGIRGLFSPLHGEPVFAEYIGHEHLARYIRGFTGTAQTEELGLGTTVLFTNPRDDDYTIGWHRGKCGRSLTASCSSSKKRRHRRRRPPPPRRRRHMTVGPQKASW